MNNALSLQFLPCWGGGALARCEGLWVYSRCKNTYYTNFIQVKLKNIILQNRVNYSTLLHNLAF